MNTFFGIENYIFMENIFLLIPLIIITLIFVPVTAEIRLTFNPLKNVGTFAPYLFGIRLGYSYFSFKGRGIYIVSEKSRKELVLSYTGPEVRFYNQLNAQIADKFYLRAAELYSHIGMGEAMKSALLSSLVQNMACTMLGRVKNNKNESAIVVKCHTAFNMNVFQLACLFRFSISIFDVVYSIIMSVIITRRIEKYLGIYY